MTYLFKTGLANLSQVVKEATGVVETWCWLWKSYADYKIQTYLYPKKRIVENYWCILFCNVYQTWMWSASLSGQFCLSLDRILWIRPHSWALDASAKMATVPSTWYFTLVIGPIYGDLQIYFGWVSTLERHYVGEMLLHDVPGHLFHK